MFETPVLFIVFNRPELTQQVFQRIRLIKPKVLFIAADGPRENVQSDILNCRNVREIVSQIDWECDVRTNFREKNVGIEIAIRSALKWFFNEVEYGIILEDDCLPNDSFFLYCERLLKKFANNDSIEFISGSNYCDECLDQRYNYFIGDMGSTWGWATWSRVFKDYQWEVRYELGDIKNKMLDVYGKTYTNVMFDLVTKFYGQVESWDVLFLVNNLMNNKRSITPSVNLVSNIGSVGTHFNNFNNKTLFMKTFDITFDIHFEEKYIQMPSNIKKRIIKSIIKKQNPLTLRDKLHFFRSRVVSLFRKPIDQLK